MRVKYLLCAIVFVVGVFAARMVTMDGPARTRAESGSETGNGGETRVIVELVGRNDVVTVRKSAFGLRYDIKERNGRVIVEDISEAELEKDYFELYVKLKEAVAEGGNGIGYAEELDDY